MGRRDPRRQLRGRKPKSRKLPGLWRGVSALLILGVALAALDLHPVEHREPTVARSCSLTDQLTYEPLVYHAPKATHVEAARSVVKPHCIACLLTLLKRGRTADQPAALPLPAATDAVAGRDLLDVSHLLDRLPVSRGPPLSTPTPRSC